MDSILAERRDYAAKAKADRLDKYEGIEYPSETRAVYTHKPASQREPVRPPSDNLKFEGTFEADSTLKKAYRPFRFAKSPSKAEPTKAPAHESTTIFGETQTLKTSPASQTTAKNVSSSASKRAATPLEQTQTLATHNSSVQYITLDALPQDNGQAAAPVNGADTSFATPQKAPQPASRPSTGKKVSFFETTI